MATVSLAHQKQQKTPDLLHLKKDSVTISGVTYLVRTFDAPDVVHVVSRNRTCSCGETNCGAIRAVLNYLKAGGKRPPNPVVLCPICGSETVVDTRWMDRDKDGKRCFGWQCKKGGRTHFFEAKTARIQKQLAEKPYLFPPVYDENGKCTYAGVRRDEVMTYEQCAEISQRVFLETGYDPTA